MPPDTALTLPLPNAHFIWYCAWFSLPSAIYAYSHATSAHLALCPASVWATSLLYWHNPIRDSWRRTLDIAVVLSGVTYQTYYVYTASTYCLTPFTKKTYTALIGISASLYGISAYYFTRLRMWEATYAHASIHLIANIANMVLYYNYNRKYYPP